MFRNDRSFWLPCLILVALCSMASGLSANESPVIRSRVSGFWSEGGTWEGGKAPGPGDRVLILQGHEIEYDADSEEVIRGICVSGALRFSKARNTVLNVGLIRIEAGNEYSEEGFDCLQAITDSDPAQSVDGHRHHRGTVLRPCLEVGTPTEPIPADVRATIRLHHVPGMNPESCPAIVCCGGRMEIHGAPMQRTWVKLKRTADSGVRRLFLADPVEGWKRGDRILITGTARQESSAGNVSLHVNEQPGSEVRTIRQTDLYQNRGESLFGAAQIIEIDAPLQQTHVGGDEFSGEVANLSRNVVVESADPKGTRGHTMYHEGSSGSISYAEFRHLGKKGVLGRYPIHFHLAGTSMRGASVVGASIWDSHNRWITIHGTQYLLVRDCVGYQSLGHGYYLEDGTEVFNILDRNLAVQALITAQLPKQALPFDLNDGAGFWWANSLNAFTRNVAVECDQHGFRFEAALTQEFPLDLPVPQPDGTSRTQDIRTIPFICFDDNETHCQRRFGLNLGGIRGMTHPELMNPATRGGVEHAVQGSVDGVGPDSSHPFQIRNFKVWDTHWAFHCGSPCVSFDGLNIFNCNYGIWRSVIDRHQYNNLSFRNIHTHAISFPMGGNGPGIAYENGRPVYPTTRATDDFPPVSLITRVRPGENGHLHVEGVVVDNETVDRVHVNGIDVPIRGKGCNDWSLDLPVSLVADGIVSSQATDDSGNIETRSHQVEIPAVKDIRLGHQH